MGQSGRPDDTLTGLKRRRVAGDGREARALEADDDDLMRGRVLVDLSMRIEAQKRERKVVGAQEQLALDADAALARDRRPLGPRDRRDAGDHRDAI